MAVGDAKQFEGAPLQRGGRGDHGERGHVVVGLDVVGADGGQVGEQAGETVYRVVVLGAFADALASAGSERCAAATGSVRLARAAGLSWSQNKIGARACFMCQLR